MRLAGFSTSQAMGLLALAFAVFGCGSEERPAAPAPAAPAAPKAAPAPAAPPAAAPAPAVPAPATAEPVAEAPEWEGEIPADFPADVPRYPGAKVTSTRGAEDMGVSVTFDSPDSLDKVAKFYSDGLAAEGWQAQTHEEAEGTVIIGEKDNRRAHAMVYPGGQGTLVNVIVIPVE